MFTVVNTNNEITGYIINNTFVSSSILKMIISNIVLTDRKLYGVETSDGVLTSCGFYKNIEYNSYRKFVDWLISNNIELNDILFIPCDSRDISKSLVSDLWKLSDIVSYSYLCMGSDNLNVIAYLLTLNDLYESDDVKIGMLECIEKRKNNGTRIVSQLKRLNKRLTGLSVVNAVEFWSKQGATIDNNRYFKL